MAELAANFERSRMPRPTPAELDAMMECLARLTAADDREALGDPVHGVACFQHKTLRNYSAHP